MRIEPTLPNRQGRRRSRGRTRTALLLVSLVAGLAGPVVAAPMAMAQQAVEAPVLLAPQSGSSGVGNPVLRWEPVSGAAKYRVEVSNTADFAVAAYKTDTVNTVVAPPVELPLGVLHWRVAALGATGTVGPQTTSTFTKTPHQAPELVQPADRALLAFPADPPLFEWKPLPGAKTYEVEVDDDAGFVGAVTRSTDLTSYTLTEPQTGGTYYWRVRGTSGGLNSQWSEVRSYAVTWPATPVLTAPADTGDPTVEDVVLRWEPVRGAATYRLQVSPNGDWSNNVALDVNVKSTQFSPVNSAAGNSLNNGNYFWRVQALDARTVPGTGAWSEVDPDTGLARRFQRAWVDQPTLIGPEDGAEVDQPAMSWTPVDHASHYEVQLSTDPNFTTTTSPANPRVCYTNQTSLTPYRLITDELGTAPPFPGADAQCAVDPDPTVRYYWRVRAIDAPAVPAVLGVFSTPRSFTYAPATPERLVEPTSRPHAPVISWAPSPDISRYKVTVYRPAGTVLKAEETSATSYTPTVAMADGTYSWTVQTVDPSGRTGYQTLARGSFTVAAPEAPGGAPDALEAVDAGLHAPSLQWEPVADATDYEVYVGRPGATAVTALTTTQKHAAFTPLALLEPGDWQWFVIAKGTKIAAVRGASGTFSIDAINVVTKYQGPAACAPSAPCTLGETPQLSWDRVAGAGSYRVYLANDPAFTNRVRVYKTQYTSLTPREALLDSQAGQAYYWFVRPCQSATSCGPLEGQLGKAQSFRKASLRVVPVSPAAGAVVGSSDLRFEWEDYRTTNGTSWTQSARAYRLQVSTVEDFSGTHVDDVVVDQTSYAPWSKTYPEGPLFWRVQAIDGSGNALPFSAPRRLTKSSGSPKVLAPTEDRVDRLPFFRWQPMPAAAAYDVEVYKNGDTAFSSANLLSTGKATTMQAAWSPVQAFGGQGDYAWRLRAVDVDGKKGEWSAAQLFQLQSAEPPLVAPAAGASNLQGDALAFDWDTVPGAASYRFQSSTSSTFTTGLQQQVTVMTEWAPTAALTVGTHHWRVQVLDARGNVLGTSASHELFVTAPPSPTDPATPTTPATPTNPNDPPCTGGGTDSDKDGRPDSCDDVVDLHNSDALYPFVRTLMKTGISTGCADRTYCPAASVTRAQMAVFLLRAAEGADYVPPKATGVFADVPANGFAANYIEELRRRGITTGCTTSTYCPNSGVTRSQMAVFLLRAAEAGGFKPPAPKGVFTDVPTTMQFADWIEELSARKITSGCSATTYCPGSTVTRRQMAAFLVRAFEIPLA